MAHAPFSLDSRSYAYLRAGDPDRPIADYDAALKLGPEIPESLFGHGVAYAAKGDKVSAASDIAAARMLSPTIDQEMARIHVTAPTGL